MSCPPIILFDVAAFRLQFPAFADPGAYPDATLQAYWDAATCYVSDCNAGILRDACRTLALNLMTAHIAALMTDISTGQPMGFVSSSTIDKISVTIAVPPSNSPWQFWLNQTPYGLQLRALLDVRSVGGWVVGGSPEVLAFRGAGWCGAGGRWPGVF